MRQIAPRLAITTTSHYAWQASAPGDSPQINVESSLQGHL